MGIFDRLLSRIPGAGRPGPGGCVDFPPPPPGFGWHHFSGARAAVLRPDGWHVHQVTNDGSFTGCVSRECIPAEGSFRTGLTLQQIRGVIGRVGLPPSVLAVSIFQRMANDRFNTVLLAEEGGQQQAGASTFLFRHRNAPGVAPPIVVHSFYIARDVKDEINMFTFESPEASWDESWAIGDQILKHLMIDVNNP